MSALFYLPRQIAFSTSGALLAGAKLLFFQTATSTPQNTYQDLALTTPHANPVVADANGFFASIYLDASLPNYRVRLTTSADVQLWQQDDVPSASGSGGNTITLEGAAPEILIKESGVAAHTGNWRVLVNGGLLRLFLVNDSLVDTTEVLSVSRAGASANQIDIGSTSWEVNIGGLISCTGGAVNLASAALLLNDGNAAASNGAANFTPTYTGFSADPAEQFRYVKVGNIVAVYINAAGGASGTSNATGFTWASASLPAAIRPSNPIHATCLLVDNGNVVAGHAEIAANGGVTFGATEIGGTSSWTNSGTKGFNVGFQLMYVLK